MSTNGQRLSNDFLQVLDPLDILVLLLVVGIHGNESSDIGVNSTVRCHVIVQAFLKFDGQLGELRALCLEMALGQQVEQV